MQKRSKSKNQFKLERYHVYIILHTMYVTLPSFSMSLWGKGHYIPFYIHLSYVHFVILHSPEAALPKSSNIFPQTNWKVTFHANLKGTPPMPPPPPRNKAQKKGPLIGSHEPFHGRKKKHLIASGTKKTWT